MPELPEVETIRADLEARLAGRRFTGADILWPGSVDRPAPERFGQELAGRRIERVDRRGKFLIFHLSPLAHVDQEGHGRRIARETLETYAPPQSDGDQGGHGRGPALVVHLRMTGRLRWRGGGAPRERHLRVVLTLDDDHELHFEDQRKFGRLSLVPDAAGLADVLAKLGPEPLLESFTRDEFRSLLSRRRGQLKPLLLNQRFVAGLGNIYVDEALFRAGLHPLRRSDTLVGDEISRLYDAVIAALRQGIANRGTTLSAYRDTWGTAGRNQEQLLVFRRQGQPCPRCGSPIEKIRVAGRGTHLCPRCQALR